MNVDGWPVTERTGSGLLELVEQLRRGVGGGRLMGVGTSIEWTEVTWNPTTGCDRISPGCDNCYALTLARRLKAMGQPKYQRDGDPRTSGPGFGVTVHEGVLGEPLRWRRPRRVFVNSMSDIGHARVPAAFVAQVFAVMAVSPQHSFQLLTKRPGRLASMLGREVFHAGMVRPAVEELLSLRSGLAGRLDAGKAPRYGWPLPNVWVGTSIESDEYSWRADELRQVPAAVRFLSLEPLLGPVPSLDLTGLDWVIVGGESGPHHRRLDLDWVRDVRDRCVRLRVALFFKQVGGLTPKAGGRLLDGRTWDEYPACTA
jgi:protein gp37